ncbi:Guanine nucleotide-binding-like protein 1 [Linnemannia schmuckeri]|uniref:Guanine nucleotide-binding protein-like 1 n=1 Tax=Linnemannia schmuckeri TaxID=64567 RepID=A0A9P5VCN6_9FUNG|nr:Guanine nucleotide-binding-like protein 1 [Linnemannia schmuckeri]
MERATAYSGAKKKVQLQERRARHRKRDEERRRIEKENDPFREENIHPQAQQKPATTGVDAYNGRFVKSFGKEFKPDADRSGGRGDGRGVVSESANHAPSVRIRSVFMRRSAMEIKKSRLESMKPLEFLPESALEVSFEEMFPNVIGFPTRPKWDYSMSREEVDKNEKNMFEAWMDSIYDKYPADELSYFEHNLDVWRQLWRVLEISDIIMIIVDIRHPVIHFPPSLYQYVVKDMKRKLVVVFNKVDLVAPNTVFAWTQYFKEQFPELHIATFSCYPPDPSLINDSTALKKVAKRPRRRYYNPVGVKDVLAACKDVELSKNGAQIEWDELIAQYDKPKEPESHESDEELNGFELGRQKDHRSSDGEKLVETLKTVKIEDDETVPHSDYVTIGLVGHPNVGKSSLINSIMGRTVVSTSKTPGHTKHFQTIHLTHNVRLCDSPGLVFPSLLPKPLQILSGMFPIAQVQEPYSVVQYLAERVNIPRLLKLDPPPTYTIGPFRWSAYGICESFGLKRGFMTAKTSYADTYRAANALLQMANDGRILLSFKPPGFFTSTKYEQLRVNEADTAVVNTSTDEDDDEDEDVPRRLRGDNVHDGDEDEDEVEEEEEEEEEEPKKGSKFQVNSRVGGFFGLLQDDDDEDDDESEEDDDEDDASK